MNKYVIELEIEGTVTVVVEAKNAQDAYDFAVQEGTNSDGTEGDVSWEFGDVVVMRNNETGTEFEVSNGEVEEESDA